MSPVFPSRDVRDGEIVGSPETNVIVVIGPVVVPIAVEHARICSVVPIARSEGEHVSILSLCPIRSFEAANPSADHRSKLID